MNSAGPPVSRPSRRRLGPAPPFPLASRPPLRSRSVRAPQVWRLRNVQFHVKLPTVLALSRQHQAQRVSLYRSAFQRAPEQPARWPPLTIRPLGPEPGAHQRRSADRAASQALQHPAHRLPRPVSAPALGPPAQRARGEVRVARSTSRTRGDQATQGPWLGPSRCSSPHPAQPPDILASARNSGRRRGR